MKYIAYLWNPSYCKTTYIAKITKITTTITKIATKQNYHKITTAKIATASKQILNNHTNNNNITTHKRRLQH